MWFTTKRIERSLKRVVEQAMSEAARTVGRAEDAHALRQEIETLKIEKGRREEEFSRREREVEHKVGLERKRQEFEISQSKREATVTIREENLKADRDRFEAQMKFHDDRFTQEVGYLKTMVSEMLERLPSADISITRTQRGKP